MNDEDKEDITKLAKKSIEDAEIEKVDDDAEGKRETSKLLKDLKIIAAISIGKNRNKELARVLDTDKSFAAKKVKDLEDRGLVHKEGEGKETRYRLDVFNVMKFLQSKVIITAKKKVKEEAQQKVEEVETAQKLLDEVSADEKKEVKNGRNEAI